jgi:hypothetical protein
LNFPLYQANGSQQTRSNNEFSSYILKSSVNKYEVKSVKQLSLTSWKASEWIWNSGLSHSMSSSSSKSLWRIFGGKLMLRSESESSISFKRERLCWKVPYHLILMFMFGIRWSLSTGFEQFHLGFLRPLIWKIVWILLF